MEASSRVRCGCPEVESVPWTGKRAGAGHDCRCTHCEYTFDPREVEGACPMCLEARRKKYLRWGRWSGVMTYCSPQCERDAEKLGSETQR